jgi:transposase
MSRKQPDNLAFQCKLSNWNTKAKAETLAGTKQYSPDLNAYSKKIKTQTTAQNS